MVRLKDLHHAFDQDTLAFDDVHAQKTGLLECIAGHLSYPTPEPDHRASAQTYRRPGAPSVTLRVGPLLTHAGSPHYCAAHR
ncbi:MAG: hypothetical protein M3Q30_25970 [Actinomycetota bacterium]|jgi:hypothetical protein|nr:hypothetical protein [Actinomycetota bacterium]